MFASGGIVELLTPALHSLPLGGDYGWKPSMRLLPHATVAYQVTSLGGGPLANRDWLFGAHAARAARDGRIVPTPAGTGGAAVLCPPFRRDARAA